MKNFNFHFRLSRVKKAAFSSSVCLCAFVTGSLLSSMPALAADVSSAEVAKPLPVLPIEPVPPAPPPAPPAPPPPPPVPVPVKPIPVPVKPIPVPPAPVPPPPPPPPTLTPCGAKKSFNVKKYGAVGDGKTNDSPAFNAAAKAAAAVGGLVYAPSATYALYSTVTLNSTGLYGDGAANTLLLAESASFSSQAPMLLLTGNRDCVSSLTLESTNNSEYSSSNSTDAINVQGATAFSIQHVVFKDVFYYGIALQGKASDGVIAGNTFSVLPNSQLTGAVVFLNNATGVTIENNVFNQIGSVQILSQAPGSVNLNNGIIIASNQFLCQKTQSIQLMQLSGLTNCQISNNVMTATPSLQCLGIFLVDENYASENGLLSTIVISNNRMTNVSWPGVGAITLYGYPSSGQPGISNVFITNNSITEDTTKPQFYGTSGACGIFSSGTPGGINGLYIAGNTITNVVTGVYLWGANNVQCNSNTITSNVKGSSGEGICFSSYVGGTCSIRNNKLSNLGSLSAAAISNGFGRPSNLAAIEADAPASSVGATSITLSNNYYGAPPNSLQYFIWCADPKYTASGNATNTLLPSYIK